MIKTEIEYQELTRRAVNHCANIPLFNEYACKGCGKRLIVKHRDKGVTPAFIKCTDCKEMAHSLMYRRNQGHDRWHAEWYRPSFEQYKNLSPWERQHIENGGVLLTFVGNETE